MVFRRRLLAATVVCATVASGCSGAENTDQQPTSEPTSDSTVSPFPATTNLPAGDLPAALTLKDVRGRTIAARPFADFAVAAGTGIWVSGVAPGIVRYGDDGSITASAAIRGDVTQALEQSDGEVLVPSRFPNALTRIDATTGRTTSRVRFESGPVVEGAVGAIDDVAYVLLDEADVGGGALIAVVRADRATTLPAPEGAVAVRAAFGSLWVPTRTDTVERYDLATEEWRAIAVGPNPRFLDVGYGAVWVMNQGDGSVTRIDVETDETEDIPVTGQRIGGGDLTTGGGAVWLRTDSQVARIDPETRRVTHLLDLPPGSGSVAATERALLVTNHDHLAVHLVPLPLPR